jgi:tetratricopeptide (TPR) repeat protein
MRQILFAVFALVAVLHNMSVASAFTQDDELVWLSLEGQKRIFERKYDSALQLFKNVEKEYPMSALGYFGEMAVYEVQMLEREDFHLENELLDAAKRGEEVVDKVMQLYHPSDFDLFYAGGFIGLEGFFKARHGWWWGAYTRGNISRQIFNTILKRNPDFVDAWFGLGMYMYWRSVFTNEIKFLPFFSDKRAEGIAIVERVAKEGRLAAEMAHVNLGIIYFEEKRYADAITIFEDYLKRFPQNVLLHQFLGRVLLADKKYDRAIEQFKKVLAIDPTINKAHYFIGTAILADGKKEQLPEAEQEFQGFLKTTSSRLWRSYTLYWLGQIYEKQGNTESAKQYYEEALKLNKGLKGAQLKLRGLGGGI